MKRLKVIFYSCLFLCMSAGIVHAAGPEVIWAGGSLKVSNEAKPEYAVEPFLGLGDIGSGNMFCEPVLRCKNSEIGLSLGVGTRTEVLSGQGIAGYNLFFDYTGDHNHKQIGAGAEFYHSDFSAHLNIYIPLSDRSGNQEALPGINLSADIPIPQAPFVSVCPGVYYFNGRDEDDLIGISLAMSIQPNEAITFRAGARNDALGSGRDNNEIFAVIDIAIPMNPQIKDMLRFNPVNAPVALSSYMDDPVRRYGVITYEKKTMPWDLID